MCGLDDPAAVQRGPVDRAVVAVTRAGLAEIGEPEPAPAIQHEVVRPAQPATIAGVVEPRHRAGRGIDPLDAAAAVVGGLAVRAQQALRLGPGEAAIVAADERAIRGEGQPVRPAARRRQHGLAAGLVDGDDAARRDLDQRDAAIRQHHGSLREAQAIRQDARPGQRERVAALRIHPRHARLPTWSAMAHAASAIER
jgi:hypothetical protein